MSISIMFLHTLHTILYFTLPLYPTFLLDRISFPLMYCLYIRKCQTCRNVKDCRATWECLGVGKKYQLMSLCSANKAVASVGGVRVGGGPEREQKETLTPGCVTLKWHYKPARTVHRVDLALCTVISIWPLQAFAVIHRPLVGQVPGLPGHRSHELSGVGSIAD